MAVYLNEDVEIDLTEEQIGDLITNEEPWDFFQYCMIEHRNSKAWVPYQPSVEQQDWTECLLHNKEAINLKGRNIGIGVATQTFQFWRAWRAAWLGTGLNTLVVAHSSDTAARHLERYKELNERLPDCLRLEAAKIAGGNNASDYKLRVPGSDRDILWFRCVTAGGKKGQGRGFTAQQAHLTEYAFYEMDNYASLTGSMHQGSPWYSLAIESTPDPEETNPAFRERYFIAKRNRDESGDMVSRFYAWPMQESFRLPVPPDFERTTEEEHLATVARTNTPPVEVRDENLAWRRKKLGGPGPHAESILKGFRKEYPLTEDDAFRTAKREPHFSHEHLRPFRAAWAGRPVPEMDGERLRLRPEPGMKYAGYLDVATGIGQHHSSLVFLNARLEQVYAWSDPNTGATDSADRAVDVAMYYNCAILGVDGKGVGHAAYLRVRERDYPMRDPETLRRDGGQFGTLFDQVMSYAKLQVEMGRAVINDYYTIAELETIPRSMRKHGLANGSHWDNAVAWAYALWLTRMIGTMDDASISTRISDRFRSARDAWDRYGVG